MTEPIGRSASRLVKVWSSKRATAKDGSHRRQNKSLMKVGTLRRQSRRVKEEADPIRRQSRRVKEEAGPIRRQSRKPV